MTNSIQSTPTTNSLCGKRITRLYRKWRAKGYRASESYRNARAEIEWDDLDGYDVDPHESNEEGVVRFKVDWDDSPDLSFIEDDAWTSNKREYQAWKKKMERILERDGALWICSEFKNAATGEWEHGDSLGGLIGMEDVEVYEWEVKAGAIQGYKDSVKQWQKNARMVTT